MKPTIEARARKRLDDVEYLGNDEWVVWGNEKLGDSYEQYRVHWTPDGWTCECSTHQHGQYRRFCSHAAACVLYKKERWDEDGTNFLADDWFSDLHVDIAGIDDPVYQDGESNRRDQRELGDVSEGSRREYADAEAVYQAVGEFQDGSGEEFGESEERDSVSATPSPSEFTVNGVPLPGWVKEYREAQWQAISEIVQHFDEGADVVILDAPTGSGKTLIAETVRRILALNGTANQAVYVCSSKELQDQFLKDYPYAKVLKGKSNYPTQSYPFPEITCADCTNKEAPTSPDAECAWCPFPADCSYQVAKRAAQRAPIMVINTAYFLNEANYVGRITSGGDFIIVDEGDTLEDELMGFVQFEISQRMLDDLGLKAPKKGSHKETILTWLEDEFIPKAKIKKQQIHGTDVRDIRRKNALDRAIQGAQTVLTQTISDEPWVRDNDAGPLVLKPVKVDWAGKGMVWQHGKKWLVMSATIISPEEFVSSLGLQGLNVQVVRHPMTFPVENRRIIVAGVASVTAKNKETAYDALSYAINKICDAHPNDRVLVHTVSYELARALHGSNGRRNKYIYSSSADKKHIVDQYAVAPNSIIFAPSLERGTDFKHELCRVIIVAKMPFKYLGDRQISARLHTEGGNEWYAVQTVRSLVQMTGRGVRSEDDYAVTYILDQQFMDNVYKRSKYLLPDWWAEALDFSYPVKKLLQ